MEDLVKELQDGEAPGFDDFMGPRTIELVDTATGAKVAAVLTPELIDPASVGADGTDAAKSMTHLAGGNIPVLTLSWPAPATTTEEAVDTDSSSSVGAGAAGTTVLRAAGGDFFAALQELRLQLEPHKLQPAVQGATMRVWASGMARQMSLGLAAYEVGFTQRPVIVDTLAPAAPHQKLASVRAQRLYTRVWGARVPVMLAVVVGVYVIGQGKMS